MGYTWAWRWWVWFDGLTEWAVLCSCWWRAVQVGDVSQVGLTSSWGERRCIFVGVTQVVVRVVVVAVDVLEEVLARFGLFWCVG